MSQDDHKVILEIKSLIAADPSTSRRMADAWIFSASIFIECPFKLRPSQYHNYRLACDSVAKASLEFFTASLCMHSKPPRRFLMREPKEHFE